MLFETHTRRKVKNIFFRNLNESKKSLTPVTDEDGIMNFLSDFEIRNSDLKFELQMKRLWNKYCDRKMDEKKKSIEVKLRNFKLLCHDLDTRSYHKIFVTESLLVSR